jgi:hypothetical protein
MAFKTLKVVALGLGRPYLPPISGPEEVIFTVFVLLLYISCFFVPQRLAIFKSIAFNLLFGTGIVTKLRPG